MVAKDRERLAVSKQAVQKFGVKRFILSKLNELKVTKQYQIKFSNRFAALGNFSDSDNISRAWENIEENVS